MSGLPGGWAEVEIGEIAEVVAGGTPKANDASNFEAPGVGIAWLTPADLSGYKAKEISKGSRDLSLKGYESCSAKLMPKGSLLFSSRAPIGYVALAANDISTNQGFKSFIFPREINPSFAYYYLKSIRELADSLGTGTTFKELSGTTAKTLPFRMAPTSEQTRIAQKLDELLAQVDTLKARIDAIPVLLKRFRQSVLAAAVSGRLTEEWRTQHSQPVWELSTFGDAGAVSGGLTKNAKRSELSLEKPYLRVANVHANKLILDDVTSIGLTEKEFEKTKLRAGDILIVEGNGSLEHIGRAAIWGGEVPDCSHQNHLIRWRATSKVLPNFALYQLLSPQGRKQLVELANSTTGLHTLSITKVAALSLPVPTPGEQAEIVRRVEQLFAFADQLESKVASAKTRIDHLTQSILAKAFRGELVPQDPNDEPASALLERIRAQRAAAPKTKRTRKTSA